MAADNKRTDTPQGGDAGQAEVQAKFDEAAEKGYFGETPDPTPNEAYTLKGVTSGQPTPETTRAENTPKQPGADRTAT